MNVMGLFKYEDDFLSAARNLRTAGYDDLALMSPIPLHEAEEILGIGKSPVRHFSLAGALIGAVSGFTLAVATALVFILPTAGRAIITVPPYLIITYEMTILFGVLSTLLGFHVVSGQSISIEHALDILKATYLGVDTQNGAELTVALKPST